MLVCGTTVEGSVNSKTARIAFISAMLAFVSVTVQAETQYPKPTELPNPYRLVEGWPAIPKTMNGGHWGEVIRVHVASDGNIWVFHRCFNVVPPGHATCINRGAPIRRFSNSIRQASCSEVLAPGCTPIHTDSLSTGKAICGPPM